jgi:hypothetical protein
MWCDLFRALGMVNQNGGLWRTSAGVADDRALLEVMALPSGIEPLSPP